MPWKGTKVVHILDKTLPQKVLDKALHYASQKTNFNILSALLSNGAQITEIAVLLATRAKSIPLFELFMQHGWKINDCGVAILRSV